MRIIGAADEFWRVRLTKVDTTEGLDFEWHDDILYREPKVQQAAEVERFDVEAVRLDDPDTVVVIASFEDAEDAHAFIREVELAMPELTKSQFEERYTVAPHTDAE